VYYSMGDTKTPVRTAARALFINLALNLMLMFPLKIGGLALATSIAATTNFVMLYVLLTKKIGDFGTREILTLLTKVFGSTAIMSLFILFAVKTVFPIPEGLLWSILRLATIIVSSGAIYVVSCYFMRVDGAISLFRRQKNV
jgi:putative peptidoglycan lipid II flippase